MSKFTADEVYALAVTRARSGDSEAAHALHAFVHRLRQEEAENRRDPVMEPKSGDRVQYKDGSVLVYCEESDDNPGGTTDREFWRSQAKHGASTIILRREVQQ